MTVGMTVTRSLCGQVVRRRSRKPKIQGSIPCGGNHFQAHTAKYESSLKLSMTFGNEQGISVGPFAFLDLFGTAHLTYFARK